MQTGQPVDRPMTRVLTAAGINAVGSGMYLVAGIIYLVHGSVVGPSAVGVTMLVGGLLGTGLSLGIGRWADRIGAVSVTRVTYLLQALGMALAALPASVAVVAGLLIFLLGQRSTNALSGTLAANVVGPERAVIARATIRAVNNGAIAAGSLAAGLLLTWVPESRLWIALLGNAGSFLIASLVLPRQSGRSSESLARSEDSPSGRHWRLPPRFVAVSVVGGIGQLHFDVQSILLPLWLIALPSAVPPWSVGYAFALNTAVIVLGQRWHAAWMEAGVRRRREGRSCGILIAAALLGYGSLAFVHGREVGLLILTIAVVMHSIGEIQQANAFGAATFDLTPEGQFGYLQAFYWATGGAIRSFSALLMTWLAITRPPLGWTALAGVFMLTGLVGAALIPEGSDRLDDDSPQEELVNAAGVRAGRNWSVDAEVSGASCSGRGPRPGRPGYMPGGSD